MSWFLSIRILWKASLQPQIFWAILTYRLSSKPSPPILTPCPSLMWIWCWNFSRLKSSSLQPTASSHKNNCSRFCNSTCLFSSLMFKFSCLIGVSATFEETKRRTALCITEGGRCDSGKPRVHFFFSHFPKLHFPGGPGSRGLGAEAAREEARCKVGIL